ncbi:MAG: DUF1751 domain-containing protein [Archangium sp.]|nr:DUF1751 domain-containing protein [Archangium sp.]
MVAVSILQAVFGALRPYVLLVPDYVIGLPAPWTPLTYAFVATDPFGVIFGALILVGIGSALEQLWGPRRFVLFSVGMTALGGVSTFLVAQLWSSIGGVGFAGARVMTGVVWVAYGLAFADRPTSFWGLPMTGRQLALVGVAFVGLEAAFYGLAVVLPSVFALAFVFLSTRGSLRGLSPGFLWTRFRSWQLNRDLKRRAAHLRVVSGDSRNMSRDSDKFLH